MDEYQCVDLSTSNPHAVESVIPLGTFRQQWVQLCAYADGLYDRTLVSRLDSMVSLEYNTYRGMVFGGAAALLVLEAVFLFLLPLRILVEMCEKVFEITRSGSNAMMLNFFGVHIDFELSRRFRLSLIGQLVTIAWINVLLLLDGCGMQIQNLSGEDMCPKAGGDCFRIGVKGIPSHQRVPCEPGQVLSNGTSSHMVCFIWVYGEQNVMSVINQIGICSSVFSLLCYTLKVACRCSHRWWGLVILTLVAFASLAATIVSMAIELQISVTAKLLLIGSSILLFNVIQLFQFTHHCAKVEREAIKQ